jgi:hypothetical protein
VAHQLARVGDRRRRGSASAGGRPEAIISASSRTTLSVLAYVLARRSASVLSSGSSASIATVIASETSASQPGLAVKDASARRSTSRSTDGGVAMARQAYARACRTETAPDPGVDEASHWVAA